MKRILIALAICGLMSGCISEKVQINTAYPFEKRYSSRDKIIVNGEPVIVPNGKSVWILSSDTLKNLLIYAGGDRIE